MQKNSKRTNTVIIRITEANCEKNTMNDAIGTEILMDTQTTRFITHAYEGAYDD